MAICTECGAIIHKEDAEKHICEETNKPQKGIMHINGKKIDIKTKLVIQ